MERRVLDQFMAWKGAGGRKPLVLMGARQVGKTYSLQSFAEREYENNIYLNFEDSPSLKGLFDSSIAPDTILRALEIEMNTKITPEKTLIIFDEIQECPNALNSLKYFNEEANEYHVCAAGSLLGVKLLNTKGFPVGKVNFIDLYPMGFTEFLEANDEKNLSQFIQEIDSLEPLPSIIHDKLDQYFKEYMFVGGMPEAVANYVKTKTLTEVRKIQKDILGAYNLDFAKHAPKNSLMKINQVWDAIPNQLAKENKKFIYSAIRKGARAKEFEIAIQWLKEAGLIHKIHDVSTPQLPLKAYASMDFFKIYLMDVGIFGAMADIPEKTLIHGNDLFQIFRGSLTENYVAQELARMEYGLYYWTSQGKAELDYIIQYEEYIFPIEVKSGNSKHKKSMHVYNNKYHPKISLRISPKNLKLDGNLLNVPLYLLGQLGRLIDLV